MHHADVRPPTIVVAVCGNPRKYHQSFTALMRAAEEHNVRLAANATKVIDATLRAAGEKSTAHTSPYCFFRFLNLHYDRRREQMFLSTSATPPPPPPSTSTEMNPHATSLTGRAPLTDEVDVHVHAVIHKVATFGTREAAEALNAWVEAQQARYQSTLPLVLDSVSKVDILNSRVALYELLDTVPGTCIARTYAWSPALPMASPTCEMWTSVGAQSAIPLRPAPFQRMANGFPDAQWWIIKPDEGSGPAFTHHLVMWCGGESPIANTEAKAGSPSPRVDASGPVDAVGERDPPQTCVPVAVQKVLPAAAKPLFIVQELYTAALPIVLKVYCIGSHVFVKVSPTVKMLAMLRDGSRAGLNTPVFLDSQDKELFTGTGLPTASSSQSPSSQRISLAPSGDYSAVSPTAAMMVDAEPGAGSRPSAARQASHDSLSTTSIAPDLVEGSATSLFESVVPTAFWDAWLAPGTPARTRIETIAADLRCCLGLGLFGFDILLVPAFLAHPYQRDRCPTGFGEEEKTIGSQGGTGKSGGGEHEDTEKRKYHGEAPSLAAERSAGAMSADTTSPALDGDFWGPEAMFDLATGEPTDILRHSVPCVIDVNYFPGFKGWAAANDHMLDLIAHQVSAEHVLREAQRQCGA